MIVNKANYSMLFSYDLCFFYIRPWENKKLTKNIAYIDYNFISYSYFDPLVFYYPVARLYKFSVFTVSHFWPRLFKILFKAELQFTLQAELSKGNTFLIHA